MRLTLAFILAFLPLPAIAKECGKASFYANFFDGRRTASGSIFHQSGATCAHRSLPFGTKIRVTAGGRSVLCTVTDRGPFVRGRIVDLSRSLAAELGIIHRGVAPACIERAR